MIAAGHPIDEMEAELLRICIEVNARQLVVKQLAERAADSPSYEIVAQLRSLAESGDLLLARLLRVRSFLSDNLSRPLKSVPLSLLG